MSEIYNLWYNQDLKLEIVENMKNYGGSFVKALAELIVRADKVNLDKICTTFANYIEIYHPDNRAKK